MTARCARLPPAEASLATLIARRSARLQSIDVILVFKTRKSVEDMAKRKWTLGVDGSVAAGPVGRRAKVATDIWLKAEVFAYSRSRGIFAGISSGGAVAAALSLSKQVQDAVIVVIICDRGDRYLSTGVFPD